MQNPRVEALKSTPSLTLTMWTEWLRHGLSTPEDQFQEFLQSVEAQTRKVPFPEVELLMRKQAQREKFLRACWERVRPS